MRPFYRSDERYEFWKSAGDMFVEHPQLRNYFHIQFPEQQNLRVPGLTIELTDLTRAPAGLRFLSQDGRQIWFMVTNPQTSR